MALSFPLPPFIRLEENEYHQPQIARYRLAKSSPSHGRRSCWALPAPSTDTFARNPADHDAVRQHGHRRGLAHYRHMLARPAVHQGLREEGYNPVTLGLPVTAEQARLNRLANGDEERLQPRDGGLDPVPG